MLFWDDPFMRNEKYAAGSLDSIADGVLLNQRQVAQILGITPPTAKKILTANNLKTIRLSAGRTSPIFVAAGDLKKFLENGAMQSAAPSQTPAKAPQVKSTAAPQKPTEEELDDLYEFAKAAARHSVIINGEADESPFVAPQAVELPPSAVVLQAVENKPQTTPTPKGKKKSKKTPDEALAEAGLTRWRGKKGVKGYGAKG